MERQVDFDAQAGQADMLQALRSASLPDEFWMYSYKILPCPHGYRHSWTHCPFSHAGETARRRCPRTHHYLPDPCVNARAKRQCPNGDACPYAHNTFEQWLHPARYRTRLCYLGANCRRPTCFFAHSVEELRSVDENDPSAAIQPASATAAPLPPLPIPPPLPSPSSSGSDYAAAPSAAVQPQSFPAAGSSATSSGPTAAPAPAIAGTPAAPPGRAVPMGLFHGPIALVCMPQSQGPPGLPLPPHLMPPPGALPGYLNVAYSARPASLARPPQQQQQQPSQGDLASMSMSVPMPAQALMPLTMRAAQPPRPNQPGPTVAVAAVHGVQVHMTPAGPVYVHAGMPGPMAAAAGVPLHGPPQSLPLPPGYAAGPYGMYGNLPAGGSEGVLSSIQGRMRFLSNPGGDAAGVHVTAAAAPAGNVSYGQRNAGFAVTTLAAPAPAAATSPPSASPLLSPSHSGTLRGVPAPAPRHMPAPTNRGNAVRRVSTPASLPAVTAASVAAAAVAAMRFPDANAPSGRAAGATLPVSNHSSISGHFPTQTGSADASQMDAAFSALSLTGQSVAAPPPTPAASHAVASPYSPTLPASVTLQTSYSSEADSTAVAVPSAEVSFQRASMDAGSAAAASGFSRPGSRPSSAGSSQSGSVVNAFDASAAAAAAALAAAAAADTRHHHQQQHADAVAAVAVPYRALLQQVLRSASSTSAADQPAMLLPVLLSGSGVNVSVGDLSEVDLPYDDVDGLERSSDPGPNGLRAAIRRISSELGSAAACRNSDPGCPVPSAGVQQLLLPLLQSVLTEGLATGQFELVNGQLQVKTPSGVRTIGSSGSSGSGYGTGNGGPTVVEP